MFQYSGAFRGKIVESKLDFTKKNQYPKAVIRLESAQRYIEEAADLTHYQMKEPAWVDWAPEQILGQFCLFNSAEVFDEETQLPNYKQLKIATGWDGSSFDSLNDGSLVSKQLLFRVAPNKPYQKDDGTMSDGSGFQVVWLDAYDADPVRALKPLDAASLATANSKLKMGKTAPKPMTAAKPTASASIPATAPSTSATTTAGLAPTAKPPKTSKPPKATAPAEDSPEARIAARDANWDALQAVKGNADDSAISNNWITACATVAKGRKEEQFTVEDWAAVKDAIIAALGLK